MRALIQERFAHQALTARPTGTGARFPRVWPQTTRSAGSELDLAQLPVDVSNYSELQDPVTGELYFVPGISLVDGPDLIQ